MSPGLSRAAEHDWPRIWPLWHEVIRRGDTYAVDPLASMADGRTYWLLPEPAQTWFVAEDEAVLGTYLLKPNQGGPGSHIANAGFMVGSAARGRGIGRLMAEHCLDQARAAGYLGMQFNAVVASNYNAIRLWQSLGFATIGSVPRAFRHPVDGLVDLHVMYRDL